jgi:hypothetical protein
MNEYNVVTGLICIGIGFVLAYWMKGKILSQKITDAESEGLRLVADAKQRSEKLLKEAELEAKDRQLAEATSKLHNAAKLVESKDREVRIIKESTQRAKVMNELLSPLNEEKKQVMKTLLESVQTPRLHHAFDKYLPAVLNTGSTEAITEKKTSVKSVIVEATGDKTATKKTTEVDDTIIDNVIDIKRLAGL